MSISQAAMVVLAGCGVTATTEYTTTDQAVLGAVTTGPTGKTFVIPKCPDPNTDCTHSNGSGVFFEEGGNAGINAPSANAVMFMITTFMNPSSTSPSVTLRGRYADSSSQGIWQWANGTVDAADLDTMLDLQVVNVSEDLTMPTWTIVDPTTPSMQIPVTGDSLLQLKLHLTLDVARPSGVIHVPIVLSFDHLEDIWDTDPKGNIYKNHPVLHGYNLQWSPDDLPDATPTQYCYRGPNAPVSGTDPVVFQRGISVDPVTGIVKVDPNAVTMSCARGAVAKAYNFGYPYVDAKNDFPSLYASAIHMKRAAYCGDWNHYTVAGIAIGIRDSSGINAPLPDFALEAQWSPQGATCVNLQHLRSPDSPLPAFNGTCPSKPTMPLPDCSTSTGPAPLESYTVPKTQGLPGL